MSSITIKVTHLDDTRIISAPPQDLLRHVADRFQIPVSNAALFFDGRAVDIPKILALGALKPGKAIKYTLLDDARDQTDQVTDPAFTADQVTPDNKAAKKVAKLAAKAAKKAARPEVSTGRLFNLELDDGIAGELNTLPCGRVCFHAQEHKGNLRVSKGSINRKGGTGSAAQFSVIYQDAMSDVPVFRLASQSTPCVWLGASPDAPQHDFSGAGFALVGALDPAGLWSFFPHADQELVHILCDKCGLNPVGDTFDLCQSCLDGCANEARIGLLLVGDRASNEPVIETLNVTSSDDNTSAEELTDEEEPDLKLTKQQLMAAKRAAAEAGVQAKIADKQAKLAAKQARIAVKEAENAEKVEARASARAAKLAARHVKVSAKQAKEAKAELKHNKVIPGKLVNWGLNDSVTGELIVLPCGRVCLHAHNHPGNLRVSKQQVQRRGGLGEWAQFSAISEPPSKPSMFRLSQSPCVWLGASPDAPQHDFSGAGFALVGALDPAGLWSFFPEGALEPLELDAAQPLASAHEVYAKLKGLVHWIGTQAGVPIQMEDAPEDEAVVIGMLNKLHELLPHPMQRIAMKKAGLRKFAAPEPEEWDLMLEDLQDMGFESPEANRQAVLWAGGDMKKAIKSLMQQARSQ